MRFVRGPVPVLIVAGVYLAVGVIGLVVHFRDLLANPSEGVWMEVTELVAIATAVFLLRGRNWARWLAVAWIAFHIVLSVGDVGQLVVHSVFAVLIAWLLFRPDSTCWFRPPPTEPA